MADQAITENAFEKTVYTKVTWHIMPWLFLCFIASYLDRVNVSFAKLQMLDDLKFSETVYGLGAGIFFLGYFLFEIPSNMILYRVGARLWIARIMIVWGIISAGMAFVNSPTTFYIMRFLLGVAEAGFFPGVIFYLTLWYPAHRRGKMTALFFAAVPISSIIGGPLSGWILETHSGIHGLAGWQWMFILEAIPSVLLGILVFFYLQDRIQTVTWLTAAEKQLLLLRIQTEAQHKQKISFGEMLCSGKVWRMGLIYFCFVMGLYGVTFWLPTIIKTTGINDPLEIGLLTAIPYIFATIAMFLISYHSDTHNERKWHIALPALISSLGLILSTIYTNNTLLAMTTLTIAMAGIIAALPLFWSLPTAFLGGSVAAAGIALINSLGNLAGFISPYLIGWLKEHTQSTNSGMFVLATSLIISALLTISIPKQLITK